MSAGAVMNNRLAAVNDGALSPDRPNVRPALKTDSAALYYWPALYYRKVSPQRVQVVGWAELHRHTQPFEKVRPAASQCGSKTSGQRQGGRKLFAPVSEASADKTINNIKAVILIVVFIASPLGKLFVTLR